MDKGDLSAEVDRNYDFFQRNLASFLREHAGEYALIKERRVLDFFVRAGDAYRYAKENIADGLFSIQEVTDEPIDLGFFSHVAH